MSEPVVLGGEQQQVGEVHDGLLAEVGRAHVGRRVAQPVARLPRAEEAPAPQGEDLLEGLRLHHGQGEEPEGGARLAVGVAVQHPRVALLHEDAEERRHSSAVVAQDLGQGAQPGA